MAVKSMRNYVRQRGFTLIELLVGLVVFSLLMVSAFQLFHSALDVNQRSQDSFTAENKLALVWSIIFQDMLHIRARPHRDIQGDLQPAFETTQYEIVRFVRGGYPPVAGITPGGLMRVAYRLDDSGNFIRQSWPVIDLANQSEVHEQILLRGVESVELALLAANNEYSVVWPPLNRVGGSNVLPRMIRITLHLQDGRALTRLLPGVDS